MTPAPTNGGLLSRLRGDRTFLALLGLVVAILVRSWRMDDAHFVMALPTLTDLVLFFGLAFGASKAATGIRNMATYRAARRADGYPSEGVHEVPGTRYAPRSESRPGLYRDEPYHDEPFHEAPPDEDLLDEYGLRPPRRY